jgi:excisionase family DNA binding protein
MGPFPKKERIYMKIINISQAADLLKVAPSWVRYKVFKKQIPFLKVGRHIRFDESEIRNWLSKNSMGAL